MTSTLVWVCRVGSIMAGALLVGCVGGSIQMAMDNYASGYFRTADAQFAELESQITSMNPKGYVRYCTYRGLTRLALGDPATGCAWLRRGRDTFARGERRWLPENVETRMRFELQRCGDPVVPWP